MRCAQEPLHRSHLQQEEVEGGSGMPGGKALPPQPTCPAAVSPWALGATAPRPPCWAGEG